MQLFYALHIFILLHAVLKMFYLDSRLFEHFKAVCLVMIMLFAYDTFDATVDDEHCTCSTGSHLAVHCRAVYRNAPLGSLTNCILLSMYCSHTMLRYRAVIMHYLAHEMPHIVAMRQACRRTYIAGDKDLIVARYDAATHSPVTRCTLCNGAAHFHKVFIPCRANMFC